MMSWRDLTASRSMTDAVIVPWRTVLNPTSLTIDPPTLVALRHFPVQLFGDNATYPVSPTWSIVPPRLCSSSTKPDPSRPRDNTAMSYVADSVALVITRAASPKTQRTDVLVRIDNGTLSVPRADIDSDKDAQRAVQRLVSTHFSACDQLRNLLSDTSSFSYSEATALGRRQAAYAVNAPYASSAYTLGHSWTWAPVDSLLTSVSDPALQ